MNIWAKSSPSIVRWLAVATVLIASSANAANLYYIYPDQVGTPRLVTDTSGNAVWTWNNDDPFGNNAPNTNPSSLGTFIFNPRFPGQYADSETNLNYNTFRDYNTFTGRYVESDPIGLRGGINTYIYVNSNSLSFVDPYGEVAAFPLKMPIPIRPIPLPPWLGPAAAVVDAGVGGYTVGSLFYPIIEPTLSKGIDLICSSSSKTTDICRLAAETQSSCSYQCASGQYITTPKPFRGASCLRVITRPWPYQ